MEPEIEDLLSCRADDLTDFSRNNWTIIARVLCQMGTGLYAAIPWPPARIVLTKVVYE